MPLPKQRPTESLSEYSQRLEKAVQKKLEVVQKKVNTDHQRERQKERAKAAKEKKKAKQKAVELEAVRLSKHSKEKRMPRTRPKFGEVVQRPPSFSKVESTESKSLLSAGLLEVAAWNVEEQRSCSLWEPLGVRQQGERRLRGDEEVSRLHMA